MCVNVRIVYHTYMCACVCICVPCIHSARQASASLMQKIQKFKTAHTNKLQIMFQIVHVHACLKLCTCTQGWESFHGSGELWQIALGWFSWFRAPVEDECYRRQAEGSAGACLQEQEHAEKLVVAPTPSCLYHGVNMCLYLHIHAHVNYGSRDWVLFWSILMLTKILLLLFPWCMYIHTYKCKCTHTHMYIYTRTQL